MKNLQLLISFLALGLVLKMNAQQDPNFSTYKYNLSMINPAVAGSTSGEVEIFSGFREQWTGTQGAPQTQTLNINSGLGNNLGAGLNVINDKVFIVNEIHLYADFSYKLELENSNLFLGIKAGGSFLNIDLNKLDEPGDPLLTGNVNVFNPNVGVGAFLKGEKYFISLSAPGLLQADRIEKEGIQPSEATDRIHSFLSGGYDYDLNDAWQLKPATMVRVVPGAPVSIDATLTAQYKDIFEFGGNYRIGESITGIATFVFADYGKIGFAYEYTTTEVNQFNNGTVEMFLKFLILNKKKREIEAFE